MSDYFLFLCKVYLMVNWYISKIKIWSKISKLYFVSLVFSCNFLYAQSGPSLLDSPFLEGLPTSVRDQVETQNEVQAEEELEKLFRSETSVEKNKVILERLKKEIKSLDQKFSELEGQNKSETLSRFGEFFFDSAQSSFMPVNVPNLSADYIIDVGDKFDLLFTGKIEENEEVMVQRDGSLAIPGIGKVQVAGKTLEVASETIKQYVKTASFGVETFVSLSDVRDVQVLMLGNIDSPGIYTLSGGSSVLAALNVAGGISESGSYRKIDHKRNGEIVETIDLYDVMIFGNFKLNNTLRSGDTIFVHPSSYLIPVTGGVNVPAIYEAKQGESIQDLVNYASGFSQYYSGFKHVYVNRVDLTGTKLMLIQQENLSDFFLEARDSVQVPSYKNTLEPVTKVSIVGEVFLPGEYVMSKNATLSDAIILAGGYKEDAYIYGSALFRKDALAKEQLFAQLNYSDTVNYIISNIGKADSGSIDSSVIDLLAEELRSRDFQGRVIANFNLDDIKQNPALDMRLIDGDVITIPKIQKVIYLFGDFRNPSNFLYDPQKSVKDYIEIAGGLKESAYNEILVIDPDGNTHTYQESRLALLSNSVELYPGSIIYAQRNIGKLSGVSYAATVSPILSSLAISLASLNSITKD